MSEMPFKEMNHFEFVLFLKREVKAFPTQSKAARAWGISPQYLSDVLKGNRKPGPKLLKALGFEEVPRYAPQSY